LSIERRKKFLEENYDILRKRFRCALINKGMTTKELAKILGIDYTYLGMCVNYTRIGGQSGEVRKKAYDYMGFDPEKILEEVRENDG
jgi:hypothetical protein